MISKEFEYYAPNSLQGALSVLSRFKETVKILAGGQALNPLMKYRLVEPAVILDVNRIEELSFIREDSDGSIRIGALTRHTDIENSELIRRKCPILEQAASTIGDVLHSRLEKRWKSELTRRRRE